MSHNCRGKIINAFEKNILSKGKIHADYKLAFISFKYAVIERRSPQDFWGRNGKLKMDLLRVKLMNVAG